MDRNINIIVGLKGEKIVLINDIRFKGKKKEDCKEVEDYLKEYVGEVCRYNIFFARMLVRHAEDDRKYLYDMLAIKKETSSPLV